MQTIRKNIGFAVIMWLGVVFSSSGATIYDNTSNDLLTRFSAGTREVGDEIILGGTERYLTNFTFEFYGTNTASPSSFAGSVEARVRFYRNDGGPFNGYATPGSSFYDSGWFSVPSPTERSTFIFSAGSDFPVGGLFIPDSDITWSVQFQGMGLTDEVGVDIYSPVTVGANYPDYWSNDGSGWMLLTNSVPMDFAARMEATVPEPSSAALAVFGGLGALLIRHLLRRKE